MKYRGLWLFCLFATASCDAMQGRSKRHINVQKYAKMLKEQAKKNLNSPQTARDMYKRFVTELENNHVEALVVSYSAAAGINNTIVSYESAKKEDLSLQEAYKKLIADLSGIIGQHIVAIRNIGNNYYDDFAGTKDKKSVASLVEHADKFSLVVGHTTFCADQKHDLQRTIECVLSPYFDNPIRDGQIEKL